MPKIAVWNVENFGAKNQSGLTTKNYSGATAATKAESRLTSTSSESTRINAIVDLVRKTQPDIFVLVEVLGEPEVKSALIANRKVQGSKIGYRSCVLDEGTGGILASLTLALRQGPFGSKDVPWCLVPPRFMSSVDSFMRRGNTGEAMGGGVTNECVAVFYNSDKIKFEGPYQNAIEAISPPAKAGQETAPQSEIVKFRVSEPNPPKPINYRAIFTGCLPDKKETLSGFVMDLENNKTHKYDFHCNMPFVTRFTDKTTGLPFDLISFHASRNQQGTNHLATAALLEGLSRFKQEDVEQIVVGDFNDSLDHIDGESWKIGIPQGFGTDIHKNGELLGGKFPNYGYLSENPSDNVFVSAKCQLSTIICNPFVGFPYNASATIPYQFSPTLSFDSLKGKAGIEKMIADPDNGIRAITRFFITKKEISNHLPFIFHVEFPSPKK